MSALETDVVVVGGGAAGLAAAAAAREAGARVVVVSQGPGASTLTSGVVWGHAREGLAMLGDGVRAGGRYVTVGAWVVGDARGAAASLLDLGAVEGMLGVVDLPTHPSWSARLVAETLGARVVKPSVAPAEETFRETAARLDTDGIAEGVAASMRAEVAGLGALLFPPVLGLRRDDVAARMSHALGLPVGEAAGGVGDPPGVRLDRALRRLLPGDVVVKRARASVKPSAGPSVALSDGGAVHAKAVVLATGGLTGGGLAFEGTLRETAAGAPVWTRSRRRVPASTGAARGADPAAWFGEGREGVEGAGVRVDAACRVLDADGESPLGPWLLAAGDVTAGLEGRGLADALAAGRRAGVEAARVARG